MRSLFIVLWNEFNRSLFFAFYYRLNTVVRSVRFIVQFIGFSLLFGRGNLQPGELQASFIGYMLWPFIMLSLIDMTWLLTQEVQTGSFEQFNMSIVSARVLLLARMVATMCVACLESIFVACALMLIMGIWPLFSWTAVPVIMLSLVGLMGFTLFIGALTLQFKHTEAVSGFILTGLSFLNGAILPVYALPVGLQWLAFVLPTTQGINVLRKLLIQHATLPSLIADSSLLLLILHTTLLFSAGWFFYRWIEARLKAQGTLGHY